MRDLSFQNILEDIEKDDAVINHAIHAKLQCTVQLFPGLTLSK